MFRMEKTSEDMKPDSAEGRGAFESAASKLVHETRGLLSILKSVKGLEGEGSENQLYRLTLKRFRDNCLRLASYMEACSMLAGVGERDRILQKLGCRWDDAKRRVSIG